MSVYRYSYGQMQNGREGKGGGGGGGSQILMCVYTCIQMHEWLDDGEMVRQI